MSQLQWIIKEGTESKPTKLVIYSDHLRLYLKRSTEIQGAWIASCPEITCMDMEILHTADLDELKKEAINILTRKVNMLRAEAMQIRKNG